MQDPNRNISMVRYLTKIMGYYEIFTNFWLQIQTAVHLSSITVGVTTAYRNKQIKFGGL